MDRAADAAAPGATIPARQNGWAVAVTYLGLGVEHILLGFDHLLFVLGLILIAAEHAGVGQGHHGFHGRA